MGFFAKTDAAGWLDDRRNDVKSFKGFVRFIFLPFLLTELVLKLTLFILICIFTVLKKLLNFIYDRDDEDGFFDFFD